MRKMQISSGFVCILFTLAMVLGCNKQDQGSTPAPEPTPVVETQGGDQPQAVTTSTVPASPQETTTATQQVEPQATTEPPPPVSTPQAQPPQKVSVERAIPNATFVYEQSEVTEYKAPIKLIHTMFEAKGAVTNLALVYECTGDTDTHYRAEFQLIKGKATKYGLGPRMVAKAEGEMLKPGDRVTVKVLTQIPQVFAPEEITGVRIFLKDLKNSHLALIEKSGLELEKGNISVIWTFDPSIQPSVTPADEPADESTVKPADKPSDKPVVKKKAGKNGKKRDSKPTNE